MVAGLAADLLSAEEFEIELRSGGVMVDNVIALLRRLSWLRVDGGELVVWNGIELDKGCSSNNGMQNRQLEWQDEENPIPDSSTDDSPYSTALAFNKTPSCCRESR
jgi:hypothetical protein